MSVEHFEALTAPGLSATLNKILRGMEKESLRIDQGGRLAQTQHPASLGSALCHPEITTDYSEALLEFITPTYTSSDEMLAHLDEIQRFVYANLDDENLWPTSMPCILNGDDSIPVANYGQSNIGKMKTIYRLGLGHRYGRLMQTISGIHYNFSLPDTFWQAYQQHLNDNSSLQDFKTQQYFHMIRNFRRLAWLPVYLFGAAPAVCGSFLRGREHQLQAFTHGTLYLPHATSLRMGKLGYQSSAQESVFVNYNGVNRYIDSLHQALTSPVDTYEQIGIKDQQGNYQQLSNNMLQIENEFYSTIRPKRTAKSGETPLNALRNQGVEYIEVRCLDVNPFLPLGTNAEQLDFIDSFLLYCLLSESPDLDQAEYQTSLDNLNSCVSSGREPGLSLNRSGQTIELQAWAKSILRAIKPIATTLDQANQTTKFSASLSLQEAKIVDPTLTPSAQILDQLQQHDSSFFHWVMKQAEQHRSDADSRPLSSEQITQFTQTAAQSLSQQVELEAAPQQGFDEFLADYYAQYQSLETPM